MTRDCCAVSLVVALVLVGIAFCAHAQEDCYEDVIVSGAGVSELNGRLSYESLTRTESGDYYPVFGRTKYENLDGGVIRTLDAVLDYGEYWQVGGAWRLILWLVERSEATGITVSGHWLLWNTSASMIPPSTGWFAEPPCSREDCPDRGGDTYEVVLPMPTVSGGGPCNAEIDLEKTAILDAHEAGETITFTFSVENTGDVALYDVSVYDDTLDMSVPLGTTTLSPGESTIGTLEYTVTQADINFGTFTNTATVLANTAGGTSVTDTSSTSIRFTRVPGVALVKTAEKGPFYEGDVARFTFTLANTGNVTLQDISLYDHALARTVSFAVSTLTPGSSTSASVDYTVTAADVAHGTFTNFALAEAWTSYRVRVRAEDQATIICAGKAEEIDLPPDVEITVSVNEPTSVPNRAHVGPMGIRDLSETFCQGDRVEITVSVLNDKKRPIRDVPVYGTLSTVDLDGSGESTKTVESQLATYSDGVYSLFFDTAYLDAGLYDVRIWIPGQERNWVRVALVPCGENADEDGVSDSRDTCLAVAGVAANTGCPVGDFNRDGIPDHLGCVGDLLADETYRIHLVLTTTSDTTSISLDGGELLVINVETDSGQQDLSLDGFLESIIAKPTRTQNSVRVEYDAYVHGISANELIWTITKTELGTASLQVYGYVEADDEDSQYLLKEFENRSKPSGSNTQISTTSRLAVTDLDDIVPAAELRTSCLSPDVEPLVLAYYFPWYGTPTGSSREWLGWDPDEPGYGVAHIPQSGYYDVLDRETIRRHISEAQSAGIDGFVLSWVEPDEIEDRALAAMIRIAEQEEFRLAIRYDGSAHLNSFGDSMRVIREFCSMSNVFLHINGLPVVFVDNMTGSRFVWSDAKEEIRLSGSDVFLVAEGVYMSHLSAFSGICHDPLGSEKGPDIIEPADAMSLLAKSIGKLFVAVVNPGMDTSGQEHRPTIIDRQDGQTYQENWSTAIASDPDWIVIRSFNQWLEGTEIESSEEFGTIYLDLALELGEAWKDGQ